eukprot:2030146-Alexandrium_andersonii.AAC.1
MEANLCHGKIEWFSVYSTRPLFLLIRPKSKLTAYVYHKAGFPRATIQGLRGVRLGGLRIGACDFASSAAADPLDPHL